MYLKANTDEEIVMVVYTGPCTHETKDTFGISHLLEHMICESYKSLEEIFQERCITNNAFTDKFSVCFYIRGLRDELNKFKEEFVQFIINYEPKLEHFTKELPIVKQEYNDCFSNTQQKFHLNISNCLYGETDPIGTKGALDNITFEKVVEFYHTAFRHYSIHEIASQQQLNFNDQFNIISQAKNFNYVPIEKIDHNCIQCALASEPIYGDKLYLLQFICDMLDDGLTSPLMKEVREKKGLSYWVQSWPKSIDENSNSIIIASSVQKKNLKEFFSIVTYILKNYKEFLTVERFNQIKSKKEISLKLKNINNSKTSDNFRFEFREETNDMKNLDKITYDEVIDFYEKKVVDLQFEQFTEIDFWESNDD